MRELRVALIIDRLETQDAAGGQLSLLAERLNPSRFSVTVCVLGRADPALIQRLQRSGLKTHVFDRTHGHDLRVLYRLKELLALNYTDVACTWMLEANIMGRLAARWAHVPVIVAVEQDTAPRSFVRQQIDRFLAHRTQALVADNEAAVAVARRSCLAEDRLRLIRPGVEGMPSEQSEPSLPDVPAGWSVALAACPLVRQMGLLHLVWALSILRYADQPLQLWIAGEGPEKSRLADEASRLDVGSRVHFLGRRDDLAAVLPRVDVFVLPTRRDDTSPAALLAMALGVPAVLPDIDGFRHLTDSGRCARLVEPGYPKSIAAGVFQAVQHAERSRQMAAAARDRIREHYDAERFVREYEDLFVELARTAGLGT